MRCIAFSLRLALAISLVGFTYHAGDAQTLMHVRVSTPDELDYADGVPLPPLWPFPDDFVFFEERPEVTSDYWVHEDQLWRLTDYAEPLPADPSPIPSEQPGISVVIPWYNYSRRPEIAFTFARNENHFDFGLASTYSNINTQELRIPEDLRKEFVAPLGQLSPGEYTVTAKSYAVLTGQVSFSDFTSNPLDYSDLRGFRMLEEQFSFSIDASASFVPGDINFDGAVDAADLNILGQNWLQNVTRIGRGDITGDGFVDAADLNEIGRNWRQTMSTTNPVPEPSSAFIAATFVMALLVGPRQFRLLVV